MVVEREREGGGVYWQQKNLLSLVVKGNRWLELKSETGKSVNRLKEIE